MGVRGTRRAGQKQCVCTESQRSATRTAGHRGDVDGLVQALAHRLRLPEALRELLPGAQQLVHRLELHERLHRVPVSVVVGEKTNRGGVDTIAVE